MCDCEGSASDKLAEKVPGPFSGTRCWLPVLASLLPLTPTLSPSDGARESLRTGAVDSGRVQVASALSSSGRLPLPNSLQSAEEFLLQSG
jgi:hypothetical protein